MKTFFVDETGYTGEDLLCADQPVFVQASVDLDDTEAERLVKDVFGTIGATELKHSRLIRNAVHRERIFRLIEALCMKPKHCATWVVHKEFAMLTLIVDRWIEPFAYRRGINMYQDGAVLAMANMLFYCLEGFWSLSFRRQLLVHFQRMFRARSAERFLECQRFVQRYMNSSDEEQLEILRYISFPFVDQGIDFIAKLPERHLDLALAGLIRLGHGWRSRSEGPFRLVHDRSSNMARQRWIWDAYSSQEMPAASFSFGSGDSVFPMNVVETAFSNSEDCIQLQICDLLAGATAAAAKHASSSDLSAYRESVLSAGVGNLVLDAIMPQTKCSPEELGTIGIDGNKALEWLGAKLAIEAK